MMNSGTFFGRQRKNVSCVSASAPALILRVWRGGFWRHESHVFRCVSETASVTICFVERIPRIRTERSFPAELADGLEQYVLEMFIGKLYRKEVQRLF